MECDFLSKLKIIYFLSPSTVPVINVKSEIIQFNYFVIGYDFKKKTKLEDFMIFTIIDYTHTHIRTYTHAFVFIISPREV